MVTGDGIISDMGDLKAHTQQLVGLLQSCPPTPELSPPTPTLEPREKRFKNHHFISWGALSTLLLVVL